MKCIIASILFILLAVLSGCSGYFFSDNKEKNNGTVNELMLSDGSGFISTDNYNEITPFIYRSISNTWLFFASDRSGGKGGYDIYYAEMDSSGKFSQPVPMDTNINSSSNETAPVVFKEYTTGTNLFISFIRFTGSTTNIVTFQLTASNTSASAIPAYTLSSINATSIGFLNKGSIANNRLLVCDGSSAFRKYRNTGTGSFMYSLQSTITTSSPVQSLNGFSNSVFPVEIYISAGSANQLKGFEIDQKTNIKSLDLSDYSSGYNDIQPFVDIDDGYKIYFASDRFGKGNYDLYRYNKQTYDTVKGVIGLNLDAPVLYLGIITNWYNNAVLNWSSVFGAEGYEVYRYTNLASIMPGGPGDYIFRTNISATNYTDTSVFNFDGQLFYMIRATNGTLRSGYSTPEGNLHHYTN